MKSSQRKRQRQIAEKEHRGEELGRRRVEDPRESHSTEQSDRKSVANSRQMSTANSRREVHSQQQARSAYPTAGENQKEQKEQCQLQAETYEENNVLKKEVGPMTRNKDMKVVDAWQQNRN